MSERFTLRRLKSTTVAVVLGSRKVIKENLYIQAEWSTICRMYKLFSEQFQNNFHTFFSKTQCVKHTFYDQYLHAKMPDRSDLHEKHSSETKQFAYWNEEY